MLKHTQNRNLLLYGIKIQSRAKPHMSLPSHNDVMDVFWRLKKRW